MGRLPQGLRGHGIDPPSSPLPRPREGSPGGNGRSPSGPFVAEPHECRPARSDHGPSTCGGSLMPAVPRLGLVVAALAAIVGTGLVAPAAQAAPEAVVREDSGEAEAVAQAVALAEQLAERQQSLATLNQAADARDRALIGYRAV